MVSLIDLIKHCLVVIGIFFSQQIQNGPSIAELQQQQNYALPQSNFHGRHHMHGKFGHNLHLKTKLKTHYLIRIKKVDGEFGV